ncbi:hypothetical protein KSD_20340 [Ktedonobacter sp. SOSP1-85]|nr:hypothetical protein KSD_20340 [Ktedonobacter sp. SOSP1-85]
MWYGAGGPLLAYAATEVVWLRTFYLVSGVLGHGGHRPPWPNTPLTPASAAGARKNKKGSA